MQPSPSRWMQYHQLEDFDEPASQASETLVALLAVILRLVGPLAAAGARAAGAVVAPITKGSASRLATRAVRRKDMAPPKRWRRCPPDLRAPLRTGFRPRSSGSR